MSENDVKIESLSADNPTVKGVYLYLGPMDSHVKMTNVLKAELSVLHAHPDGDSTHLYRKTDVVFDGWVVYAWVEPETTAEVAA